MHPSRHAVELRSRPVPRDRRGCLVQPQDRRQVVPRGVIGKIARGRLFRLAPRSGVFAHRRAICVLGE